MTSGQPHSTRKRPSMARAARQIAAVVDSGYAGRLLQVESSPMFLPAGGRLRRRPRFALMPRPSGFAENFESRALFYDCFWHADGKRVVLVGPPPMNLAPHYAQARFFAWPLDYWLAVRYFTSLSVTVTELREVPAGTTDILVKLGGRTAVLPIQPNHSAQFAGRRVLFSMNRDNDLAWIEEWANWHAQRHGVDAVILFDNGSTRYGTAELERTLLSVAGLKTVAVVSWPWIYGATDRGVLMNPFYTQFLQVCSMSVVLRRFAPAAAGLLNLDIDELLETPRGTTVFDLLAQSSHGLLVMRGRYMEAIPATGAGAGGVRTHRDFPFVLKDPQARQSRQKKWALDPNRGWVGALDVHPYMHWIERRPLFGKSMPEGVFYRHFRGINTNWKDSRADASHLSANDVELDPEWPDPAGRG